jgi:alpha-beta hydrolase superfamily lysophospholipase
LGLLIAQLERLRVGAHGKSRLLQQMLFGAFNKPFRPARTSFDWLSRDPAEVDKYIADPRCGFDSQVQLFIDILRALPALSRSSRQAGIPKALPIYIFRGSRDPVGINVDQLLAAYRVAGLTGVTYKPYPEGRHEMLNEINRDEVTRDLIAWLDRVIANVSPSVPPPPPQPNVERVAAVGSQSSAVQRVAELSDNESIQSEA